MRNGAAGAVLALLFGCGGDSGGGSSAPVLAKVYLLDSSGAVMTSWPEGSKVMIDGEEIDLASAQLLSAPPPLAPVGLSAAGSSLTIYVPGYGGFDSPTNPDAGVTVRLIKKDLLENLFIFAPTPGRVLVGDPALPAGSRSLCVRGITKLNGASSLRYDVVLAIDRSASTSRDSGVDLDGVEGNETILRVQCESLRRYVDSLRGAVKVAVIAFERDAVVYQTLTEDRDLAKAALTAIETAGSVGATSFVDALEEAENLLTTDPNRTILTVNLEDETGVEVERTIHAPRMVILCSDGVPTLPSGSGLTQELADRVASLDAARGVTDSDIVVNAVAFGPEAAISKLTTLPGIAAITGGVYIEGSDFVDLASDPSIFGFADVTGVQVWNASLEGPAAGAFSPDGVFSRSVPWKFGDNDLRVRLLTREASLSVEQALTVTVIEGQKKTVDDLVLEGQFQVLKENNLRTPDGKHLGGNSLKDLFLRNSTQIFDDLLEFKGLETFQSLSVNPVQVQVIAEHGGNASDFGFVEYDPSVPAADVRSLLKNSPAVLVGNSGSWGNGGFNVFPANGASTTYHVNLAAGKRYAFWVIPNGKLADLKAGKPVNHPLISVSHFNPIRADHFLTYLSPAGRKGTGHGRTFIMALEDTATIDQSDRDFNDIVFSIVAPVTEVAPEFTAAGCP